MKPESIETMKKLYAEKPDVIEHFLKFGSAFEKAFAEIVMEVVNDKIRV